MPDAQAFPNPGGLIGGTTFLLDALTPGGLLGGIGPLLDGVEVDELYPKPGGVYPRPGGVRGSRLGELYPNPGGSPNRSSEVNLLFRAAPLLGPNGGVRMWLLP